MFLSSLSFTLLFGRGVIWLIEIDSDDYIVAYRQQVDINGKPVGKESTNSYHVADIVNYTKSTHVVNTASSSSSSSSSSQQSVSSLSADAMSISLICQIEGCNEDQYDVCTIDCKKMLCAKHFNMHLEKRGCHTTTVYILLF